MNPQKSLGAELLACLGIATVGGGKFPPPHRYTGIFLLFFILGIVANFGAGAARVASALGGLVTVTIAMGQAGIRLFGWLGGAASQLAPPSSSSGGPSPLFGGISGATESALQGNTTRIRPRRVR